MTFSAALDLVHGRCIHPRRVRVLADCLAPLLPGAVSLFRVAPDVLHVLNRDQTLMIGTSGWSYTLNRTETSEKSVDPAAAAAIAHRGSGGGGTRRRNGDRSAVRARLR